MIRLVIPGFLLMSILLQSCKKGVYADAEGGQTVMVDRQDNGFRSNAECAVNFHGCALANQMRACPVCIQKCGESSLKILCGFRGSPLGLCVRAVGAATSGSMSAICAKKLGVWRRRSSRRRLLSDSQLPGKKWTPSQAVTWTTNWNPQRGGSTGCPYRVDTCKGSESCQKKLFDLGDLKAENSRERARKC